MSGSWLVGMPGVDCSDRDPSMLQLFGASRATASIPFQVFHMPEGHFETLNSWLERTLSSNPVEAMFGLYDMVCNYLREVVSSIDLLEQRTSVIVRQPFSHSYIYLIDRKSVV